MRRWVPVVVAVLLTSCASVRAAKQRGGGFVLEYLVGESDGPVKAMARAHELCGKKDVLITREWDDVSRGRSEARPYHSVAITCAVTLAAVFERVRAETGCAAVHVEKKTPVGATMVYRLEACGARVVCDAAAEVACRPAIGSADHASERHSED